MSFEKFMLDNILKMLGKHTVSLVWTDADQDEDTGKLKNPRTLYVSGFVIEILGEWFLATAGHVLEYLDSVLKEGKRKLVSCKLMDHFGWDASCDHPIPFMHYEDTLKYFVDDDEKGLDCGFLGLSPYYRKLLEANEVSALSERVWLTEPPDEVDLFAIIGFPTEMTRTEMEKTPEGLEMLSSVHHMMLTVKQIPKPEWANDTSCDYFFGQLGDDIPIQSVKGMSGSPLFAIKLSMTGIRYWMIGIQSGWFPERKVIYACPSKHFAEVVVDMIERSIQELEDWQKRQKESGQSDSLSQ